MLTSTEIPSTRRRTRLGCVSANAANGAGHEGYGRGFGSGRSFKNGSVVELGVSPIAAFAEKNNKQAVLKNATVSREQRAKHDKKMQVWVKSASSMNFLRGVGRPRLERKDNKGPESLRSAAKGRPTIYEQAKARCTWQDEMAEKKCEIRKKSFVQPKKGFCYMKDGQENGPFNKGEVVCLACVVGFFFFFVCV
jgi:hypothetical protein